MSVSITTQRQIFLGGLSVRRKTLTVCSPKFQSEPDAGRTKGEFGYLASQREMKFKQLIPEGVRHGVTKLWGNQNSCSISKFEARIREMLSWRAFAACRHQSCDEATSPFLQLYERA